MASKPKKGPKGKPAGWVRTSGAIGDPCMAAMEEWNANGAGVDESVEEFVADMPNEAIMRPTRRGEMG